jgi:hypothetical protein
VRRAGRVVSENAWKRHAGCWEFDANPALVVVRGYLDNQFVDEAAWPSDHVTFQPAELAACVALERIQRREVIEPCSGDHAP